MIKLRSDVQIVPLALYHAESMTRWMQDPIVSQNIGLRREASHEQTVAWIEKAATDHSIHGFAIEVDEIHVGNVILDRYDEYLSAARFSIYIGERLSRSSGVGKTATFRICEYGFEHLSLYKIWLTVHTKNFAAINAYSQIGFALEGILRGEFLLGDERLDVLYMGLLKSDLESVKIEFE